MNISLKPEGWAAGSCPFAQPRSCSATTALYIKLLSLSNLLTAIIRRKNAAEVSDTPAALCLKVPYQILQTFCLTIGWPGLHENALKNSGILLTTPLIRYFSGECGFVTA